MSEHQPSREELSERLREYDATVAQCHAAGLYDFAGEFRVWLARKRLALACWLERIMGTGK